MSEVGTARYTTGTTLLAILARLNAADGRRPTGGAARVMTWQSRRAPTRAVALAGPEQLAGAIIRRGAPEPCYVAVTRACAAAGGPSARRASLASWHLCTAPSRPTTRCGARERDEVAALQVAQIAGSEPSGLPGRLGARGDGWGGLPHPPLRSHAASCGRRLPAGARISELCHLDVVLVVTRSHMRGNACHAVNCVSDLPLVCP